MGVETIFLSAFPLARETFRICTEGAGSSPTPTRKRSSSRKNPGDLPPLTSLLRCELPATSPHVEASEGLMGRVKLHRTSSPRAGEPVHRLSSEMIYPLLPVFLTATLAAGPAVLGLIEGVAETTASLLKLFSGAWSDRSGKRKPLVLAGYGLSTLARPLVGFATGWWHVLAVRFCDRIGKGVRTSPRDALVAAYVPAEQRGKAFGCSGRWTTSGGARPVAAFLLLAGGISLRSVFLLSIVPAWPPSRPRVPGPRRPRRRSAPPCGSVLRRDGLSPVFRRYLLLVGLFTSGNASDAFLILRSVDAACPCGTCRCCGGRSTCQVVPLRPRGRPLRPDPRKWGGGGGLVRVRACYAASPSCAARPQRWPSSCCTASTRRRARRRAGDGCRFRPGRPEGTAFGWFSPRHRHLRPARERPLRPPVERLRRPRGLRRQRGARPPRRGAPALPPPRKSMRESGKNR